MQFSAIGIILSPREMNYIKWQKSCVSNKTCFNLASSITFALVIVDHDELPVRPKQDVFLDFLLGTFCSSAIALQTMKTPACST